MAAVNFELRSYQNESLRSLKRYRGKVPLMGGSVAQIERGIHLVNPAW